MLKEWRRPSPNDLAGPYPSVDFRICLRVTVVLLLAILGAHSVSTTAMAQGISRSESDRPDLANAPKHQVHLLYVVPKDGKDHGLDTDGTIAASAESAIAWLSQQTPQACHPITPRTIRLDRWGPQPAKLDITFVRLEADEAEIYQHDNPVKRIEWELRSRGLFDKDKIYAAYYEGRFDPCAAAAHAPDIGVLALLAIGDPRCGPLPQKPTAPGEWELTLVHEVFHLLGAVDPKARHATNKSIFPNGNGHLYDSRHQDLMSWGSWSSPGTIQLDPGTDDYWEHGEPDVVDVSRSVFMEPAKTGALLPPGWPFQDMTPMPIAQEPNLASNPGNTMYTFEIINASSKTLYLYYKTPGKTRDRYARLKPYSASTGQGYENDIWVLAEGRRRPALAVWKAPAAAAVALYTDRP